MGREVERDVMVTTNLRGSYTHVYVGLFVYEHDPLA